VGLGQPWRGAPIAAIVRSVVTPFSGAQAHSVAGIVPAFCRKFPVIPAARRLTSCPGGEFSGLVEQKEEKELHAHRESVNWTVYFWLF
jgi:hypothetical protein